MNFLVPDYPSRFALKFFKDQNGKHHRELEGTRGRPNFSMGPSN